MVIGGGELRRWMAVAWLRLPARAGGVEATFAKGPIASDDRFASARTGANLQPGDGAPVRCFAPAGLSAPIAGPRPPISPVWGMALRQRLGHGGRTIDPPTDGGCHGQHGKGRYEVDL
jgi:hypothetical protein